MKKNIFILSCILLSTLSFATNQLFNVQQTTNKHEIPASTLVDNAYQLPLQENMFTTITIDGATIYPPKTNQDIHRYLDEIQNKLINSKKDFIIFKYADMQELKLKLPYLGVGNHAFVFEIFADDINTNKLLKLNIRREILSLKAGMRENYNYIFWQQQACENDFTIAKMHEAHPFGLYSIKEKNNGISLTKMLLDKNLIFITGTNNTTGYKKVTDQDLKDPQIQKISSIIDELLHVMIQHPNNCSSISPNNIFVEFEKDTKNIKKVELIDYGISFNKMETYKNIKEFNQYLEIAAKRLNKYLRLKYNL